MKYEGYRDIETDKDASVFEFISTGKQGSIIKRAEFNPMEQTRVYSLEFGDVNEKNEIDYYSISNNGDRNKILATLVNIVEVYTRKYPERWIYFCGSTEERTRLYRMALSLNLNELSIKFDIYGYPDHQDECIPFRKNMNVAAFLIKRKIF